MTASKSPQEPPRGETEAELRKRVRGKNLALVAVLAGLVVIFYVLTLVRMGGGS